MVLTLGAGSVWTAGEELLQEARRHDRDAAARATRATKTLLVPAVDLPLPIDADEPPFLRPARRTRVRRAAARAGWAAPCWRSRSSAGVLVGRLRASGPRTRRVMASERLKVARVEVRGSHFLSEGEVRELLGPAVGENILGLDIDGAEGAPARVALGGGRHRVAHAARHAARRDPRARARWPWPRWSAST